MKENEEDEVFEELGEGEAFVEELDDEETEETTGGGWGPAETWDFSKLNRTQYLRIYEGNFNDGHDKYTKEKKSLVGLGKRKVKVGKRKLFLLSTREELIHVDIAGFRKRLCNYVCL